MNLGEMKEIGDATIEKLHKSGIKTVEQLAMIDMRKAKVAGVGVDRLVELRREAQKTIFVQAATKFRQMAATAKREAASTAKGLESFAKQATQSALRAAREAEAYAEEALKQAELAAADLAEYAAQQAQRAQKAAEEQLTQFTIKLREAGAKTKPALQKYVGLLERTQKAAGEAAQKAAEAAARAKEVGAAAAGQAGQKGRSLYERLVKKVGRRPKTVKD